MQKCFCQSIISILVNHRKLLPTSLLMSRKCYQNEIKREKRELILVQKCFSQAIISILINHWINYSAKMFFQGFTSILINHGKLLTTSILMSRKYYQTKIKRGKKEN